MPRPRQDVLKDQVIDQQRRTQAVFEQSLEEDDPINPAHYQGTACLESIRTMLSPEEYRGFLRGTMLKYEWRLGQKPETDPLTDLAKARWYAEKLGELITEQEGWNAVYEGL